MRHQSQCLDCMWTSESERWEDGDGSKEEEFKVLEEVVFYDDKSEQQEMCSLHYVVNKNKDIIYLVGLRFFLINVNYISKIKLVTWASKAEYFYGKKKIKNQWEARSLVQQILAKVSYTWTTRRERLYTPCCPVLLGEYLSWPYQSCWR